MGKIELTSKLDWNDYKNFMYFAYYSKPIILLFFLASVGYLFYSIVAHFFGKFSWQGISLYFFCAAIFFLIILPILYTIIFKRSYRSGNRFSQELNYAFDDHSIAIKSDSFDTVIPWSEILKVNETNQWFLIFLSRSEVFVVVKKQMGKSQVEALRKLISEIPDLRYKLYPT